MTTKEVPGSRCPHCGSVIFECVEYAEVPDGHAPNGSGKRRVVSARSYYCSSCLTVFFDIPRLQP